MGCDLQADGTECNLANDMTRIHSGRYTGLARRQSFRAEETTQDSTYVA